MIYNRVNNYPWAPRDEYKVAEILISGRELDVALRGLSWALQESFLRGDDPQVRDDGAIGQSGIEMARARMFTGVVFRGNVLVVDTIAKLLDESGVNGDPNNYMDRVHHPVHDMSYADYLEYAAKPTVHFDALHIDVSPYSDPSTVMPPNATTINRLTGQTVYPTYEQVPEADVIPLEQAARSVTDVEVPGVS